MQFGNAQKPLPKPEYGIEQAIVTMDFLLRGHKLYQNIKEACQEKLSF